MLFVTNRVPDEGVNSVVDRRVTFDDKKSDASNSLFYCESKLTPKGLEYFERMSGGFLGSLKNSSKGSILLYIHGYNTEPSSAIVKGELLQKLLDAIDPTAVEVVTVVWPCIGDQGDGLAQVLEYWGDQDAADMTGPVFARVLSRFMAWQQEKAQQDTPCLKRLNVLAHSMGNRVLMNTLNYWATNFGDNGIPLMFRNAFLIGADIPSKALEDGQPGWFISLACRNVSVYYASDDKRMSQSKIANVKRTGVWGSRLGDQGPERLNKTKDNVYRIDCDSFNNDFDSKAGHSYFLTDDRDADMKRLLQGKPIAGRASPILPHLLSSIITGTVEHGEDRAFKL